MIKYFEEARSFITEALKEQNISGKAISRTILVTEEIYSVLSSMGFDSRPSVTVKKTPGKLLVRLSYTGEKYSITDGILHDADVDIMSRAILSAHSDSIVHSYRRGINTIEILVEKKQSNRLLLNIEGIILGILCGIFIKYVLGTDIGTILDDNIFNLLKTIFINLLKFTVAPMVFFSLASSIASMDDYVELGRICLKVIAAYIFTSVCAIAVGLLLGYLSMDVFNLDSFRSLAVYEAAETSVNINFRDTVINIFPGNIISPLANNNMLQILFMAIFFGITISKLKKKVPVVIDFITQFNEIVLCMIGAIIKFMPLIVFSSMATMTINFGISALTVIMGVCLLLFAGYLLMILIYILLLCLAGHVSPLPFIRHIPDIVITPLSLSASSAALPNTISVCTQKMGISEDIVSLTIPIGATINMDGTCINLSLCFLLINRMAGNSLPAAMFVTLAITILLLTLGSPAMPGSAIVCMSVLMINFGLPLEFLGFFISLYSIQGMFIAAMNVLGDCAVTTAISASEHKLNLEIYNAGRENVHF